jgi:hypothetical protein
VARPAPASSSTDGARTMNAGEPLRWPSADSNRRPRCARPGGAAVRPLRQPLGSLAATGTSGAGQSGTSGSTGASGATGAAGSGPTRITATRSRSIPPEWQPCDPAAFRAFAIPRCRPRRLRRGSSRVRPTGSGEQAHDRVSARGVDASPST